MSIGIIGMSLLGIATAAAMAKLGQDVICTDMDEELVTAVQELDLPGYESDLEEIVHEEQASGRLQFSEHLRGVVKACDLLFVTCEVPEIEEGEPSLRFVKEIVRNIANHMDRSKTIVLRSSMTPGSADEVKAMMQEAMADQDEKHSFEILVLPTLTRQGHRMKEMFKPKMVLIGAENEAAAQPLKVLFEEMGIAEDKLNIVSFKEAEMAVYAQSTMLALKTAYINELAALCDQMGINLDTVTKMMGKDRRISAFGMDPNPGFGGSEIPKNLRSMVKMGEDHGVTMALASEALTSNQSQKDRCVKRIDELLGGLKDKTIGILGLVPDEGSDDLREAPALEIIHGLVSLGATLRIYNKSGYQQAKWRLFKEKEALVFADDIYDAAQGADALVVLTHFAKVRGINGKRLVDIMKGRQMIDLQNTFAERDQINKYFDYYSLGLNEKE